MTKFTISGFMVLMALILSLTGAASAETVTVTGSIDVGVSDYLEISFYTDWKVLYSSAIPFTNINPTQSMCYADSRQPFDGKSDTGIMCQSNLGVTWYLKMGVATTSSPAFPLNQFKFYMGQPWSNILGSQADGTLAYSPGWNPVPQSAATIYTAGATDMNNYGYGTLATLSFVVIPEGLIAGNTYNMNITYTITTSP
ncbi:MAG: hypothetical protein Q8N91_02740 [Candidatus Omnitrophota bacterium]|nr:hypothetical protein [Candidatus Omnitrophota bacterium]